MTKFRLPIQVCVFLFREQEGGREYLLLHRVTGQGAFWQGVTGAPEEGETLLQGALRERSWKRRGLRRQGSVPLISPTVSRLSDEWREAYGPDPEEIVEHVFRGRGRRWRPERCPGSTMPGDGTLPQRRPAC